MASAAVESASMTQILDYSHAVQDAETPIFSSSDLPLQPYHTHHGTEIPSGTGGGGPNGGASGGPPPGGGDGLFVNPAFAHMSFLSDGSMVGPMGEIYSPAEYFPSLLVEHSQEVVPAVIPVSPQPGEYPAPGEYPPPGTVTPPTGVGKINTCIRSEGLQR